MHVSQISSPIDLPSVHVTLSSQDIENLLNNDFIGSIDSLSSQYIETLVPKRVLGSADSSLNCVVKLCHMPFISFTSKGKVIPGARRDVYFREFPGKPSNLSIVFSKAGLETLLGERSSTLEFSTNNGYRDLVIDYLPDYT